MLWNWFATWCTRLKTISYRNWYKAWCGRKRLLWSEFCSLLGGEYLVSDVAYDGRIGYIYVDQFDNLHEF